MHMPANIVSLIMKKRAGAYFTPLSPKKNTRSPHFCRGRQETHLHNRYGYNKHDD